MGGDPRARAPLPGVDRDAIRFQVVSEGERGLLGVGYTPARVVASAHARGAAPERAAPDATSDQAAVVRELLERSSTAIGVPRRIASTRATTRSSRRSRAPTRRADRAARPDDRRPAVPRQRDRRTAVGRTSAPVVGRRGRLPRPPRGDARGDRAPLRRAGVPRPGTRVELEPMTAVERKVVHEALKDDPEVETASEGTRAQPVRRRAPSPRRRLTVDRARLLDALARARVVATPGLTAIRDPRDAARRAARRRAARRRRSSPRATGPIVDVGSGGGTPGIPLAAALPDREVTLLEAERRKCDFLETWTAELPNLRVVWGRAEEQPLESSASRSPRRSPPPPVAAEWCLPLVREGGVVVLWVGPSRPSRRGRRGRRAARRRGRVDAPPGSLVRPQGRPDAAGIPAPHRRGEEAAARLSDAPTGRGGIRHRRDNGGCTPGSTRSRTRRAASARRRPPSTSPPASPRPASACCSSISTRRRTRPRGSATRANGASTHDLLDGVPLARPRASRPRSRTSTSSRPSPSSRRRGRSSRALAGGERYLADALAARHASRIASSSSTARRRFGPLTVNALAAADRVIVPVQAEYYALEGLSQLLGSINLVKARLNPRLAVAGILLTMVDGRTRLVGRGRAGAAPPLRRPRLLHDRAPLGAPRRGAEPRAPCDRLRPPLGRRGGLLEGGDGACRASSDTPRRGLGRGLEVLIGGSAAQAELLHLPVEAIHPNPRQPRTPVRAGGDLGPRRLDPAPGRAAAGRRAPARRGRFRADRRRAPLARRPGGGHPHAPAVVRDADDRDTLLLGLVENVAREDLSPVEEARAYALLMDEFELSLGESPSASAARSRESPTACACSSCRRRCSGCWRAATSPRGTPEPCSRSPTTTRGCGSQADRLGGHDGARGRAGGAGGWRPPTPTARPGRTVDPALADRARAAAERLTGLPTRVAGGRLEIHFGDETRLAELVETLEAL